MEFGYVIRRLLSAVPTVLLVTFMVFIAIHIVPGDVIDIMLGTQNYLTESQIEDLYSEYGLDKPLIVQYGIWVKNLLSFNLGTSLRTGRPVTELIKERFPVTLELAAFSLGFALLFGIPMGIISAIKRNGFLDNFVRVIGLIGLSSPSFWVGAILIVLVSGAFDNFNLFGYVSPVVDPFSNLQVMFLPSLTMGLMVAAQILRITRTSMLDVLNQDYVRTARAKGVSARNVILKHSLRNALIPVVTLSGIQLGYLLGGTIVIENMFALPGMGRLLLQVVNERDYPVVQGIVLFIGIIIVMLNILVDVIYTLIDPRVELR
ncbi:glutathione ABC transporter permease [Mesotoga sp. HF07.pep.5.2.highcov]|uniref:ABC-type dipeptide/oligopeptide/nickel transport system, permease component n=2 Tax=Mesotoga prima TaxID=1184387 RepID=I2F2M2_9BACT|nr:MULTISPECIES: ABC transporter permease [Mesotoga]AFK06175.1 ABC-type dipeptide/oligopeptide/nickel transport system, permease component [Mesotoga prima MesG1.Ag.4.2]PIJ61985.1 glutathione ABC transporter permease [Mesotoga sp. H07.pep.5.3]RLL88327.1 glutathione ABC transporter permease [Mesotoga sp. H07pep.5.4]RLL92226.1 glutathione ABC transporter permease [Mesotoga sp. HF07.pep.5.2.highcov]